MPRENPFLSPTICNLKKYAEKEVSYEKLMFTDYPYISWVYNNLSYFRDKHIVNALVEIGERPEVFGFCRNCKGIFAKFVCYYRGDFVTSRGRTMNTNFSSYCQNCTNEYLDRGSKHYNAPIKFSSILNYDTVEDRKAFIQEFKFAIGAPARITDVSAAKYFHDLYESNW